MRLTTSPVAAIMEANVDGSREVGDSGERLFAVKWISPEALSSKDDDTPKYRPSTLSSPGKVKAKRRLPRLSRRQAVPPRHLSTLVTKLARLDLSVGRSSRESPRRSPEPLKVLPHTSANFLAPVKVKTTDKKTKTAEKFYSKPDVSRIASVYSQVPLPDGALVCCTPSCTRLLNAILGSGKVRQVIRDMYQDSVRGSEPGSQKLPFEYVFSLTSRLPLRGPGELPRDAKAVIISPRLVPLFSPEKVGFDFMSSALVNASGSEAPTTLQMQEIARPPQTAASPTSFVPDNILSALATQPYVDQHWLKQQLAGTLPVLASQVVDRTKYMKDVRDSWVRKLRIEQKYQELSPLNKSFLARTDRLVPLQHSQDIHLSGYPALEQVPKHRRTEPRSLNTTQVLSAGASQSESPARLTPAPVWKSLTDVQKAMATLTEEILAQMEIENFCQRYGLTQEKLLALLEEFTVFALSSNTRKYAKARGISAEYLAAQFDVSIYALRAVNPALFDLPMTDERDIYGLINPCGEVGWTDFVLMHSLSVTQTCACADIVPFLLQLLTDALRTKFVDSLRYVARYHRAWMSVVDRLLMHSSELLEKPGVRLDMMEVTRVTADLDVAPLRALASEVFQSHKPAVTNK